MNASWPCVSAGACRKKHANSCSTYHSKSVKGAAVYVEARVEMSKYSFHCSVHVQDYDRYSEVSQYLDWCVYLRMCCTWGRPSTTCLGKTVVRDCGLEFAHCNLFLYSGATRSRTESRISNVYFTLLCSELCFDSLSE